MFYIVSHDISDDRKRNKAAKTLLDFGTRVQYSVFECVIDDKLLEEIIERLKRIVLEKDGMQIYTLRAKCEKIMRVLDSGGITKNKDASVP